MKITVATTVCTKSHRKLCFITSLCNSSMARSVGVLILTTAQHYSSLSPKWPFVRLFGVQEPASVLFSFLNGAAVVLGYHHFSSNSPANYHLHGVLNVQLLVSKVILHTALVTGCLYRSL